MMKPRHQVTRRRFLGGAAAIGAGMLAPEAHRLAAGQADVPADCVSTDHFWYHLQPEGPHIDSQRANKAFGYTDGRIHLSEDTGRTWPHAAAFADARDILFSHIFKCGNVLFATQTLLFISTDNLKTYNPVTVTEARGADYLPHKPKDPSRPGWYFHKLRGISSWEVSGREMLVWGS